jgi:FADH2 O2-dependent halogenase
MTLSSATRVDADVAVVGSGFGGSLVALCLLQRGQRVALIERGRHPRFAIGESTTPLANLLIEELADRYDLPAIFVLL